MSATTEHPQTETPASVAGTVGVEALMAQTGVSFGTSGARGRVEAMTDLVCYAYTDAFLQHLEQQDGLQPGTIVAIGGDLRASTGRIMAAVGMAVSARGYRVFNCGRLPSPALAFYGIEQRIPTIMVTGSHIPDDRNGIKFNKASGEILKPDEAAIRACEVNLPAGCFDAQGNAVTPFELPAEDSVAMDAYVQRFTRFFPADCLSGMRIGLYEHSSVAREPLKRVFEGLGAHVTPLGRSEAFIPVDTEAIRPQDIELAQQWAATGEFDCLVSADGDGDRPLVGDEHGEWFRGDIVGVLCARYLGADSVVTPVSSNTVVEKSGYFEHVIRTRIGSPYVIEAMMTARAKNGGTVVGYEANGGFLIETPMHREERILGALPTRDAVIVPICLMLLARAQQVPLSGLLACLPARVTASDRLKDFPTELSHARIDGLAAAAAQDDYAGIEALFGEFCGSVSGVDTTDGLRITFENGEIVHLRPSGNAPELRCYNEADSSARAVELNSLCMTVLQNWKQD